MEKNRGVQLWVDVFVLENSVTHARGAAEQSRANETKIKTTAAGPRLPFVARPNLPRRIVRASVRGGIAGLKTRH